MRVVIAQVGAMPLQEEVLRGYYKYLERGSLVLHPEYVFDLFFSLLKSTPREIIYQLYTQKLDLLKNLAFEYDLKMIVPLIASKEDGLYKQIAIIDSYGMEFYTQQILIDYPHWDESTFFSSPIERVSSPHTFEFQGLRIGVMFGFEAHFDAMWLDLKQKNTDLVIVPTASAYDSSDRWECLLRSRALCNGCMIIRVNRTGRVCLDDVRASRNGESDDFDHDIEFYGQSFVVNPDGEIVLKMKDKDELVYFDVCLQDILSQAKDWGFRYRNVTLQPSTM